MIERARASHEAGLDSLFVGDHHSAPVPYYQNMPMLGRLLAEWHGRTAGVLLLLPLWNPVLAAEQLGTLAAIHDGPFVLQCALGGGESQFAAMGTELRYRPSRFEAALDIIRRLLAGETVDADGPYRVTGARIAPVAPEPVAVWIGGSAPKAIDRAARLGDGFLIGPEATPAQVVEMITTYREQCARPRTRAGTHRGPARHPRRREHRRRRAGGRSDRRRGLPRLQPRRAGVGQRQQASPKPSTRSAPPAPPT